MLDFARDFSTGRDLQNEAIVLSGSLRSVQKDIRRFGTSNDAERKRGKLTNDLLELADQIYAEREVPG